MEAETETKKPYEYISEITFNTSGKVSVKQNDIVVFVGPNNAGKSQSLWDMYGLSESKKKPVVVTVDYYSLPARRKHRYLKSDFRDIF
ncbi:MAG: hypothetical protein M0P01_11280 [Treponema sp.]|nr:hypothetical protein [Treponema sp.]